MEEKATGKSVEVKDDDSEYLKYLEYKKLGWQAWQAIHNYLELDLEKGASLLAWMKEGEQSPQFHQLKSKLKAAGLDVSRLAIKPLTCPYVYDEPPSYHLFHIPVASTDLSPLLLWEKLKNLSEQTGYWPIITQSREIDDTDPSDPSYVNPFDDPNYDDSEDYFRKQSTERIQNLIEKAQQLDANEWFERKKIEKTRQWEDPEVLNRLEQWLTELEKLTEDPAILQKLKYWQKRENQKWPGVLDLLGNYGEGQVWVLSNLGPPPSNDLQWRLDDRKNWLLNKFDSWPPIEPQNDVLTATKSDLYIDLVPTAASWQVLEMLPICPPGNNYNLGPVVHTAILKKWHSEYGAQLVVVSGATIELKVSKPPTTKDAAMKLAIEHYLYCPDIENIKERAARILNSSVWHFWWD
jgi:hypothetical protein